MTELAIREEQNGVATIPTDSPLLVWAYQASQAHKIAQSLAKTSFVPATMKGKPDDITAAILAGDELGLRPMAALRSMDIIQGTPALRAHAMRGLVQSHGHKVQLLESTETRCRMRGRRVDDPEDQWQTVTWTIERATKLGLTGKQEWKKQPQTMLMARATGEICRLVASDVLHAMPYAVEELGDEAPDPTPTAAEAKPARRTARRAPLPPLPEPADNHAPPAEPEFDEPEPTEPDGKVHGADPEAEPEPMSQAQQRMMHALFREQGISDRAERLALVAGIIGRDVGSSSDLTKHEAGAVIDRLTALPKAEAEPAFDEGEQP